MAAQSVTQPATIYKIATRAAWQTATASGHFTGSADDVRDGYIHCSARHQVEGTAAKYFKGLENLVLIAIATDRLGPELKWEASRGGDLFPHLYAPLPTSAAEWVRALPIGPDGLPLVLEALGSC